jgi:hypothetical protein
MDINKEVIENCREDGENSREVTESYREDTEFAFSW